MRIPLPQPTQRTVTALVFCLLAAGCSSSRPAPGSSSTEAPQIASVDVVEARPQEASIARGNSGDLIVQLKITPGYHVNANPPSYSYLKPTELEFPKMDGISVEFISYPDPLTKKFPFAETPLAVYEGEAILKARLRVDRSAPAGQRNLSAKLRVQACDERVCYAPGEKNVLVPVNIK